jgi:hypothetical protein
MKLKITTKNSNVLRFIKGTVVTTYLYISLASNLFLFLILLIIRNKNIKQLDNITQVFHDKRVSLESKISIQQQSIESLDQTNADLSERLTNSIDALKESLQTENQIKIENHITELDYVITNKNTELEYLNQQIKVADSKLLNVDFYQVEREFSFDTSQEIKEKIKEYKKRQKEMYEDASAIQIEYGDWEVKKNEWYSYEEPRLLRKTANTYIVKSPARFMTDLNQWASASLLLHAFDLKCEMIIKSLKYTTLTKSISDIKKQHARLTLLLFNKITRSLKVILK